jgi:hypothetical protein
MIAVDVQLVVDAVTPLNVTLPEVLKFVPETVTDCPMPSGFGDTDEIVGVCALAKQQTRPKKKQAFTPHITMNCLTLSLRTLPANAFCFGPYRDF